MSRINFLHLTDLHQGMAGQAHLIGNVEERFYEDLERLHKKSGPWDLVLFTGDLTQKGTKEEFDGLEQTLIDLWGKLAELGSHPKLLTVPGNHDLQRPNSKSSAYKVFSHWHTDEELREDFWNDKNCEYRQLVDTAFVEYQSWLNRTTIPLLSQTRGILPGDFAATFEKDGIKLAIVGLNSTFLQLGNGNYEGKLDLSVKQLNEVCNMKAPKWIKDHHAAILMTHQPTTWLSPEAKKHFSSEIAPAGRFHMHLFGHMHESNMTSMSIGGGAIERHLQGASLFGMESWGDGGLKRIHGYSAGAIEITADQSLIKIWPRKAVNNKAGFYHIAPEHEMILDENESIVSSFNPHIKVIRDQKDPSKESGKSNGVEKENKASKGFNKEDIHSGKGSTMKSSVGIADVAIVIAMSEEFDEFIDGIDYKVNSTDGEFYYEFNHQIGEGKNPYKCVVTCVGGMNEGPAAVSTQKMITNYKPAINIILGIAGGLDKDVHVGDVLVVTQVDNYLASAKAKAGLESHYVPFELSGEVYRSEWSLVNLCNNFKRVNRAAYRNWVSTCKEKLLLEVDSTTQREQLINNGDILAEVNLIAENVHLASGPVLGADTGFIEWLHTHRDRKIKAIEMESGGFMHASWRQLEAKPTLILRGISDYGDERKKNLDAVNKGALRRYAMHNIKQLLFALMELDALPRNPQ